ncbi:hypothetical protein FHD67_20210 [Paracoccus haeundaensis]|uniref:Uncharacterized protein n=1 Tax=Paracoccus haeundaensis TaxID=225362 RepID=A0A5C4R0S1_9RHOB|nr:hypothetical protein FHD67_20210 [Paracoccus haeundaensis]
MALVEDEKSDFRKALRLDMARGQNQPVHGLARGKQLSDLAEELHDSLIARWSICLHLLENQLHKMCPVRGSLP